MTLEQTISPKISSKWLKDFNVKTQHHKIPKRDHRQTFSDIKCISVFISQSPKAIEIKTKISKWNLIKLTNFCTAKEIINKTKREPTEWEKIFANNVPDKGLTSKIYK